MIYNLAIKNNNLIKLTYIIYYKKLNIIFKYLNLVNIKN